MLQQAGLGRLLTLLGCQQLQKTLGLQLSSCGLGFPLLWGRVGVTKEPSSSRAMCCAPLGLGSSNLLLDSWLHVLLGAGRMRQEGFRFYPKQGCEGSCSLTSLGSPGIPSPGLMGWVLPGR